MSDTRIAMREFRFLDEKRKTSGLSSTEEQRWTELRQALGAPELASAEVAPQVAATEQYAQGYYADDGNWYPYPEGYDPAAYAQQGYDPAQWPVDENGQPLSPEAAAAAGYVAYAQTHDPNADPALYPPADN